MREHRLVDGVESDLLFERTGQSIAQNDYGLAAARGRGWLVDDSSRLAATAAGMQSLDRLLGLL